jgi:hypothetical protein
MLRKRKVSWFLVVSPQAATIDWSAEEFFFKKTLAVQKQS